MKRAAKESGRRFPMGARSAVITFVLVGLMFTAVYPLRRYFDFRHHIAQLHKQELALEAQSTQLHQEAALLRTPAEIERLAREQLGMVRPGEVPFVIVPPATQKVEAATPVPSSVTHRPGVFSRWWHAVTNAFGSAF